MAKIKLTLPVTGSGGGSGGVTNLSYTASPTQGVVTSDTGTDAVIPLADNTNAGLLEPSKYTVLENTIGTNTGDQDLQSVLEKGNTTTESFYNILDGGSGQFIKTGIIPSGGAYPFNGVSINFSGQQTDFAFGVNPTNSKSTISINKMGIINKRLFFNLPDKINPLFPNANEYTLATLEDIPTPVTISGKVPYTGATTNVDLGEYQLKTGQLELDQTPTGTFGVGRVRWNDSDGTIEVMLKGGNVTLQVGQEQLLRVVNKTGVNLLESEYKVVYISGAQGNRLKVDLALANNTINSNKTIGLITENINNNNEGFVTTSGLIRDINTTGSLQSETWVDGDVLYVSPTILGGLTNVLPISPNHKVLAGYVVRAHATQGSIFVKVDTGLSLGEVHNVNLVGTTAGKVLGSTTEGIWENKSVAEILGYVPQVKLITGANITIDETNPLAPVISADVTPSSVGIQQNFYLDATASLADNYTLSNSPSVYPETADAISVTTGLSPVFFERFVSQPLGKTSIPAGTWRFNIYASTSNNAGLNVVDYRINKRVIVNGIVGTWTGAGTTRTFTASSGTPFAGLTTSGNRLTAPLIETLNQTGWVSAVISNTVVTVQITDAGYVNESGVSLNAIYYWMFGGTSSDITGTSPTLYTETTVQPEFIGLNDNDRLVIAFFATSDQASARTITLYYGGTEHYTHFESPLSILHNDLGGLQGGTVGEYYHLTAAEKTVVSNTSGTNTGDNATNTQYSGLAASKQDTLVSGTNIKTINGISILGSGDMAVGSSPLSKITLTDASTTIWDFSLGSYAEWTIGGNRTLSITNLPAGYIASGIIKIIQNGTGGYTPVLAGVSNDVTMRLNASDKNVLGFYWDGTELYWSSSYSNSSSSSGATLATPTSFTSGTITSSSIVLNWTSVVNATGYTIERSSSPSFMSPVVILSNSNVLTFTDTGLTPFSLYYYRISANASGYISSNYITTSTTTTTGWLTWLTLGTDSTNGNQQINSNKGLSKKTATDSWDTGNDLCVAVSNELLTSGKKVVFKLNSQAKAGTISLYGSTPNNCQNYAGSKFAINFGMGLTAYFATQKNNSLNTTVKKSYVTGDWGGIFYNGSSIEYQHSTDGLTFTTWKIDTDDIPSGSYNIQFQMYSGSPNGASEIKII